MSSNTKLAKLIIIGMAVQLLVIGYVAYNERHARELVVTAARKACELTKKDRKASATLNTSILAVFKDSQKNVKRINSPERSEALAKIASTTNGLKDRAQINCEKEFPKGGFIP